MLGMMVPLRALAVAALLRATAAIKIVEDGDRDGPEVITGETAAVWRKIMEASANAMQYQRNAEEAAKTAAEARAVDDAAWDAAAAKAAADARAAEKAAKAFAEAKATEKTAAEAKAAEKAAKAAAEAKAADEAANVASEASVAEQAAKVAEEAKSAEEAAKATAQAEAAELAAKNAAAAKSVADPRTADEKAKAFAEAEAAEKAAAAAKAAEEAAKAAAEAEVAMEVARKAATAKAAAAAKAAEAAAEALAEAKAAEVVAAEARAAEETRTKATAATTAADEVARVASEARAAGQAAEAAEEEVAKAAAPQAQTRAAEEAAKAAAPPAPASITEDRHDKGRPQPSPPPTAPPTLEPTQEPTPEPTFKFEAPGIPCSCHVPECFKTYDHNGDGCLTQDECDLQMPILEYCFMVPATCGPEKWDLDDDACINLTEFEMVYEVNQSVCPTEVPEPCDECPQGKYIVPNPCECVDCVGETRRRRSIECTPCPAPFVPCQDPDADDCCDPYIPGASNVPNGSTSIPVHVAYQTCTEFSLGDSITISGRLSSDPSTTVTHSTVVIGISQITGGYELDLNDPLPGNFQYDTTVQQACTSTDGTQVSGSFSPFAGGCCCACGTDCCETTEVCTLYPNGTGECSNAGPYPEFSTPAPTVGAKGDPHLVNLQGEHFDINHEGTFTLLRFPQAVEKAAEFSFQAVVQPDVGKPCTTYITHVELSGAWLGGKSMEIRCYRKSHSNDTDAFLGARLLEGKGDSPWQTIEEFETKDLVLSDSESGIEVSLDKATWFPKKRSKTGPTAAGMFTLYLRNKRSPTGAKITMRQDLPEQEHLNVAVRQLSQLGRVDVGGLLGFDAHPESLERPSAACVHHRATARYRIESQDYADHGYYFRPAWKDRWDKIRTGGRSRDNEAAASFMGRFDGKSGLENKVCKCPSDPHGSAAGSIEGVLVEEASFMFAKASWE
ncbi:unnamed protein product [Prorocentrum cordatum]|uniref:Calmodulin n=1 Tax=Prorocentrum cordatum TaxID=2364126 RepID=A0ABN9VHD8_9DINO|nr:unnamed protein product [Polarella glacialis]